MIDWLTLAICPSALRPEVLEYLKAQQSRIICVDSEGVITWEKPQHTSIRSDSHQLTMVLGSVLRIMGSPTRVGLKRSDNVFGSDDVMECATRMINFLSDVHQIQLPPVRSWQCSRIDVTHNYHLGDITNVKEALKHMRSAEGGRYQVRTTAETIYWSVNSAYRSAKAYSKGEHMNYLQKREKAFLSQDEIDLTQGLIRLELSLKRAFFRKCLDTPWHQLTADDLNREHDNYFGKLIGSVEVSEVKNIESRCIQTAIDLGYTEGVGRSAFMSWSMIRSNGFHFWKDRSARSTYYRHKRVLQAAGLGWSDLCAGKVVPLRRHKLTLGQPVSSWAELRKVA